jgi:uncharacterized RDD family membrane protein YckC
VSWPRRAAAALVDIAVILATGAAVGLISNGNVGIHLSVSHNGHHDDYSWSAQWLGGAALVVLFYPWLWVGLDRGRTIGKRLLGIRVIVRGGRQVRLGRAFLREILCKGFLAMFVVPLVASALWPLWDPKNRALHDLMADTRVVRD